MSISIFTKNANNWKKMTGSGNSNRK